MLILCSRNFSYGWKQLQFCEKCNTFSEFFDKEFKEQHLFEIEILYNIINVFTVTFNQFNASLQNRIQILPQTFEVKYLWLLNIIILIFSVYLKGFLAILNHMIFFLPWNTKKFSRTCWKFFSIQQPFSCSD